MYKTSSLLNRLLKHQKQFRRLAIPVNHSHRFTPLNFQPLTIFQYHGAVTFRSFHFDHQSQLGQFEKKEESHQTNANHQKDIPSNHQDHDKNPMDDLNKNWSQLYDSFQNISSSLISNPKQTVQSIKKESSSALNEFLTKNSITTNDQNENNKPPMEQPTNSSIQDLQDKYVHALKFPIKPQVL
ncbi:hypothetical protein C9374_008755 [Naegleria lovaniensis]|uniref:Uncharacterized protein n=1 Tax=Naegleria lovaniensis TaxID=51637 RepID=A0AA88KHS4_NAELO|nr:uncharacterized protein C9374_008755 [Naegleria lovaniensis]KAG2378133.1 hypothetical protein C9374_008755 [Naegleria lovaniensis]